MPLSYTPAGKRSLWSLICLLSWGLFLSLWISTTPAESQADRCVSENIEFIPSTAVSPELGTPPSTIGVGSRGGCLSSTEDHPLQSLTGIPPLHTTVRADPTFWFYLPYTARTTLVAEFSLQSGKQEVYRTQVQLPQQPGIVSLQLPESVVPLQVGHSYRWYLDVLCTEDLSTSVSITGVIERIDPPEPLSHSLAAATCGLERVEAYATEGIWHETLTELAVLRREHPQDPSLEGIWSRLLGDQPLSLAPIVQESGIFVGSVHSQFPTKINAAQ